MPQLKSNCSIFVKNICSTSFILIQQNSTTKISRTKVNIWFQFLATFKNWLLLKKYKINFKNTSHFLLLHINSAEHYNGESVEQKFDGLYLLSEIFKSM